MSQVLSSIQKEQIMDVMFTNAKVLHHLGEKSHNFEQVVQLIVKNNLSSIQKEQIVGGRHHIWSN